ncbi:MAG TPA: hypothetical protein VGO14_01220 [Solirubrobacteraceae bacterium]|nr:hypothetical protein [Solirubrobacteraceae bacterium]
MESNLHEDQQVNTEDVTISDIAMERRERAGKEIARGLPSFVEEIYYSQVAYTLARAYMPVAHVDAARLMQTLNDAYGLTVAKLDLSHLVKSNSDFVSTASERPIHELVEELWRSEGPVSFENGRFPTERNEFVPISAVHINFETIMTSVNGVGEVADLLAQEAVEMLWSAANAPKRWGQIKDRVKLRAYSTATLVDLGFPFEVLMNSGLRGFIDANVVAGRCFGGEMSAQLASDGFKAAPDQVIRCVLDDLILKVNGFDPRNGSSYESSVKFSVVGRSEYGTGHVMVTTELPFTLHVEFLEQLIGHVRDTT